MLVECGLEGVEALGRSCQVFQNSRFLFGCASGAGLKLTGTASVSLNFST